MIVMNASFILNEEHWWTIQYGPGSNITNDKIKIFLLLGQKSNRAQESFTDPAGNFAHNNVRYFHVPCGPHFLLVSPRAASLSAYLREGLILYLSSTSYHNDKIHTAVLFTIANLIKFN
jgi:hypothetical protein